MSFSLCTQLCNHRHRLILDYFYHPLKTSRAQLQLLLVPSPAAPGTHGSIFSTFFFFAFLDTSYKWIHTVCVLLCLASFTRHHVFEFYPSRSLYQHVILFNCWISFYCMDKPHFVYAFTYWCLFGLILDVMNNTVEIKFLFTNLTKMLKELLNFLKLEVKMI